MLVGRGLSFCLSDTLVFDGSGNGSGLVYAPALGVYGYAAVPRCGLVGPLPPP
jgi:hypothetical protein